MKLFIVSLILLILSCGAFAADNVNTFESKETSISDFVKWYSSSTQHTVAVASDVKGTVTFSAVNLKSSEYDPFFEAVLNANHLKLVNHHGFYLVELDKANTDKSKPVVKLYSKIYHLLYVRNDKLKSVLTTILHQSSSLASSQFLPTTNAILVTASLHQLQQVTNLITKIDKPQRQVLIESVITESELNKSHETGVNLTAALGHAGFITHTLPINNSTDNVLFFQNGHFSSFVKAVESDANNNLLSKPTMLIADREKGAISVGQNVPFLVSTETSDGGTTTQNIERKDVGVSLEVTPHVIGDTVVLKLHQESSSITNSTAAKDIITNKRSLDTVVIVKSGQTIVLGGLVSTERRHIQSGIPLLRDIPILGWFFGTDKNENVKKDLKIVIKTTLV